MIAIISSSVKKELPPPFFVGHLCCFAVRTNLIPMVGLAKSTSPNGIENQECNSGAIHLPESELTRSRELASQFYVRGLRDLGNGGTT